MAKKINYYSRNFSDFRSELIQFTEQYYPSIYKDYNDAAIGMMLIELNAAIGDSLSFNIDRAYQETNINYAQEKKSLLSFARTFGLKIPGKRPSISLVDFEIIVPLSDEGDEPNYDYAGILKRSSQVQGGGQTFELINDVDFSSPFTTSGIPNRQVLPQYDTNRKIKNYKLVKRELVVNGETKIFKTVITTDKIKPFYEIILPENNILSIESIITLEGTNYSDNPSLDQFYDQDNRWYEVDSLADDKVFIEYNTTTSNDSSIKAGKFTKIDNKYITEYTDKNFLKIIFGSGSIDLDSLSNYNINSSFINQIGDIINNNSLGKLPSPNTTMFVRYRVGGGANTNLGNNTINNLGIIDFRVNGPKTQINFAVQNSLNIRNSSLAIGGKDRPSIDEIRYLVKYNFSAQKRAVTIKDYDTIIRTMPTQFGIPFRVGISELQNKMNVSILALNSEGKLLNNSNITLRENIANYLSEFRMMNDYVEITNGKIFNLGFDIDLFINKQFTKTEVMNNVIFEVKNYLDINKQEMGQDIYFGQLLEKINNVSGVINVIDIKVFNKYGGDYSYNEVSQPYIDDTTKQIDISNSYTIFGEPNAMFEIKYPNKDIRVRVKSR